MTISTHLASFLAVHSLSGASSFVGFSGGLDSTALLLGLHQCHVPVTAVHFQHGIRGEEAESDALWCQDFCRRLGIPFLRVDLAVPRHQRSGETVEEAARRLRLEQWRRLAEGQYVFLAHHGDDVLEELFIRLARGANASGLTSLRPQRTLHGIHFLRPFLDVSKAELQRFLEDNRIRDWRIDSTNLQNEYRRNAIRNRLLPLMREIFGTDAGIRQAIWSLRQDAAHLESEAAAWLQSPHVLNDWQQLSPALLPRVFRLWRASQDGLDVPPSRKFMIQLSSALRSPSPSSRLLQLDTGHRLCLRPQGLLLERIQSSLPFHYIWDWRQQPSVTISEANLRLTVCDSRESESGICEVFSLASLPPVLTIRSWHAGDRMIPFGHHSSKKLQDLLTDAHLSHQQKGSTALVCSDDCIIWIPYVRRAEFGRVEGCGPHVAIRAQRLSAEAPRDVETIS